MFIRSYVRGGKTYYAYVESYRDPKDKRIRQRTIVSLGTHPTAEELWRVEEPAYFAAKRKGKATEEQWNRLKALMEGLREEVDHWPCESAGRFLKEVFRRVRASQRARLKEAKE